MPITKRERSQQPCERTTSAWLAAVAHLAVAGTAAAQVPVDPGRFPMRPAVPQRGVPSLETTKPLIELAKPPRVPTRFWWIDVEGERHECAQFVVAGEQLWLWPKAMGGSRDGDANDAGRGTTKPTQVPIGQCLAIISDGAIESGFSRAFDARATGAKRRGGAVLQRADGQRFPGEARPSDDALGWMHPWLGEMAVDIESLRFLGLQPVVAAEESAAEGSPDDRIERSGLGDDDPASASSAAAQDIVVLANGDRVEGIVTALAREVTIERSPAVGAPSSSAPASTKVGANTGSSTGSTPGSGRGVDDRPGAGSGTGPGEGATTGKGQATPPKPAPPSTTRIPLSRVASIALITAPAVSSTPRLWFADGTIVNGLPRETPIIGTVAVEWHGHAGDRASLPTVDFDTIRGFAPNPSRLVPLAALPPNELRASGTTPQYSLERPSVAPGRWALGAPAITLHGPIVLDYELSSPSSMLIAEVSPAAPDPRWTACEFVVHDGEREALRVPIDAHTPPTWIQVPLSTRQLKLEVTEGERGPVCDDIRLRYAFVVAPLK